MKKLLLVAPLLFAVSSASADNYVGLNFKTLKYDYQDYPIKFDNRLLVASFGHDFNEKFAFEGQLGFGIQDDDLNSFTLNTDSFLALGFVGNLPVNNQFSLNANLSLQRVAYTVEQDSEKLFDDKDTFLGLSLGASYAFSKEAEINLSYQVVGELEDFEGDEIDMSGINLGFQFAL